MWLWDILVLETLGPWDLGTLGPLSFSTTSSYFSYLLLSFPEMDQDPSLTIFCFSPSTKDLFLVVFVLYLICRCPYLLEHFTKLSLIFRLICYIYICQVIWNKYRKIRLDIYLRLKSLLTVYSMTLYWLQTQIHDLSEIKSGTKNEY